MMCEKYGKEVQKIYRNPFLTEVVENDWLDGFLEVEPQGLERVKPFLARGLAILLATLAIFLIASWVKTVNARIETLETRMQTMSMDLDSKKPVAEFRETTKENNPAPGADSKVDLDGQLTNDLREFGFILPVKGVPVPRDQDLLPGAPREYRSGTHQGTDFFAPPGTLVKASEDGYATWADTSYQEPSTDFRNHLLSQSKSLGGTPYDALRLLEGRKIIINHGLLKNHLLTTEYDHLEAIAPDLTVGDFVKRGQIIGFVGSSGTSNRPGGSHLHFELKVDGKPLGLGLDPDSSYGLLTEILQPQEEPTEQSQPPPKLKRSVSK